MSVTGTAAFSLRRNLWIMSDNLSNNAFYIFAAKSTAWPNDNDPPFVDNSVGTYDYKINNEILFGKYVSSENVSLMIPRYDWTYGEIYTRYDDTDITLFDKKFYVMTQEAGAYHVFKCLNNNNGVNSTQQPLISETAADDVFYSTSDGYQWKYMYTIDAISFNKFASADYIPAIISPVVSGNSVYGAIETYVIDSGGSNYNSYTNGYFTDISIGGNNQFFGIQGPDTTVLRVSANTYSIGEVVTQIYGGMTANGTVISTAVANATSNFLTLRNVNNIFNPGANIVSGATSGSTSTLFEATSPDVASNNNFYNGCSIYISSGTGAGQIGKISQYFVIGNARRVLLANSFTTTPDLTSRYVITPRVQIDGDGTGAAAFSIVDPNTKKITGIEVINRGSNYTYANVTIFGNTGLETTVADNAQVRAVMPPRGGHGYDAYSELNAQQLCYSTTFTETENGKIPGSGSQYRRVGLIVNPQYSNVLVTFSNTGSSQASFGVGTFVYGSISKAKGKVSNFYSTNSTIKMSNVTGIFIASDLLTSTYANGSVAVNATSNSVASIVTGNPSVFDNRTLLVCPTSTLTGGSFSVGQKIVQIDGDVDVGYAFIQDIQTSGANTNIYLTETKGYFASSDIPTNTYKYIYDNATRLIRIRVDDIVRPDIVPYTGDVLYIKNIIPVTRDSLQSETVKLIYGFN
jgi:hypothetical protein